jgi:membrane protein implicated in regulation of membrane protease activity
VVTIGVAVLLALFLLPAPWGVAAVVSAVAWEVAEKAFWFQRTRHIPVAVGPEAMIGRQVTVVAPCRPEGKVQLSHERWNANCSRGADIGDMAIVEAIDRLTLIVSPATASTTPPPSARRSTASAPTVRL